jgi:hypothetical protein
MKLTQSEMLDAREDVRVEGFDALMRHQVLPPDYDELPRNPYPQGSVNAELWLEGLKRAREVRWAAIARKAGLAK